MTTRTLFPTDQRGVALPVAMLALLILSALVIAFSVLASTEPTIANNQLRVAQARAMAEAGVERAVWALNNPDDAKGIPAPLVGAAPAPYDGSQLVLVSAGGANVGGFRVTVTDGPSQAERIITAVGWVPDDTTTKTKAHQRIRVTVVNPRLAFKDPPAALSVRGELQVGGNTLVDARTDTSCGKKVGTLTTGVTITTGNASDIGGAADNNLLGNEVTNANNSTLPTDAHDIVYNLAPSEFDKWILTDADINALRAYAKAHGVYRQGKVTFDSGNPIPNGLVFVDTVSGNNITQENASPATPSEDFADVDVGAHPVGDPSGIFSGWLFVNGTLKVDGDLLVHGLVYAQNDIAYHGVGTGGVFGAAMSRNIRDQVVTSIDSDLWGNAVINYSCDYAKNGGGQIVNRWFMEAGTYKELCDSCS